MNTRKKVSPELIADQLKAQAIPDADSALVVLEELVAQVEMPAPLFRNIDGARRELVKAISSLTAALAVTEQEGR
jgi:hypothetical protein